MPGRPDTLSIVVTITSSPSQSVVFPKLNLVFVLPTSLLNASGLHVTFFTHS